MMPDTRARTSTSFEPSACPTASMRMGTCCGCASMTVTGIGGRGCGGPPAAFWSRLPQPATSPTRISTDSYAMSCERAALGLPAACGEVEQCRRAMELSNLVKESELYTVVDVCKESTRILGSLVKDFNKGGGCGFGFTGTPGQTRPRCEW